MRVSDLLLHAFAMSQVHLEVLTRITQGVEALGFGCQGIIESPLKGDKSGNTEFLAHYVWYVRRAGLNMLPCKHMLHCLSKACAL